MSKNPQEGVRQDTDDDPLHNIKKATILIGEMANGGFEPLGSGFVYVHTPIRFAKGKSEPDGKGYVYYWAQLWIVTCRHVICGVRTPAVRFNNKEGGTDTYPIHPRDWWPHPTKDVVVATVPTTKKLGGLPSDNEVAYVASARDLGLIDHSLTARRSQFKTMRFLEQTPVSVVGYPTGMIEGGRKDYPVVRAGHIAQVQGFIDDDPAHSSFLVESSVSPGNSGGPVVVPKGTLSIDRRQVLSDSVVVGMVSHKLDVEIQYDSGKTREDSANLAGVVAMDAIDRTIEDRLLAENNSNIEGIGRGGSIMPPQYFFAIDESNRVKYVEWAHRDTGDMTKRAWVEHRETGGADDWAAAPEGRYLVVASLIDGEPKASCDFPVFSTSEDELVLREFLHAVSPVVTAVGSPPGA